MSQSQIEIQLVAVVVAMACALPGVFLVLRKMALTSDAICHSILLGIVLAFFVWKDLSSPFLILAAAATGVLTVVLIEVLHKSGRVRQDAAVGLVFPALFSIGVILVSRHAANVHLDTDAVLLGELAFAPFNRIILFHVDMGPQAFWVMAGILGANALFIALFYKELKLSTFDAALAASLGFAPGVLHYALMALVSLTAVGAFDAVGSVLVVALMIGPPATAFLLTERLSRMLILSAAIGAVSAVAGYWLAHMLDASIAGCMASMTGVAFGLAFIFAPSRGLAATAIRRNRQRWEFARKMLAIHLLQHEGTPAAATENRLEHLVTELRWSPGFAARVVRLSQRHSLLTEQQGSLFLTDRGRDYAREAMVV